MARGAILDQNIIFLLVGCLLIFEAQKNEAEASATTCGFIAHDDGVLTFTKGTKEVHQVLFGGLEGQPTNK